MSAFRLVEFYVTDITGNVAIPVPKCFIDPVIDLCYLISPLFCGDLILCCRHVRGVKEPVLRARANMSTNQLPMPYFKTILIARALGPNKEFSPKVFYGAKCKKIRTLPVCV